MPTEAGAEVDAKSTSRPLIDSAFLIAAVQSAAPRRRKTLLRTEKSVEKKNVQVCLKTPLIKAVNLKLRWN